MFKTIHQSVTLPAQPETLYDMYLNQKHHAAITGGPVVISRTPGTRFRAVGGMISGRTLQVVPKRLIVQSWRAKDWKHEDLDSTLIISFSPDKDGCRIELTQVNVPEHVYEHVREDWEKYYWKPWRDYLMKKESGAEVKAA